MRKVVKFVYSDWYIFPENQEVFCRIRKSWQLWYFWRKTTNCDFKKQNSPYRVVRIQLWRAISTTRCFWKPQWRKPCVESAILQIGWCNSRQSTVNLYRKNILKSQRSSQRTKKSLTICIRTTAPERLSSAPGTSTLSGTSTSLSTSRWGCLGNLLMLNNMHMAMIISQARAGLWPKPSPMQQTSDLVLQLHDRLPVLSGSLCRHELC